MYGQQFVPPEEIKEKEEEKITPVEVKIIEVKKKVPEVPIVKDFIKIAEQRDGYIGLPYWLWAGIIYFVFLK